MLRCVAFCISNLKSTTLMIWTHKVSYLWFKKQKIKSVSYFKLITYVWKFWIRLKTKPQLFLQILNKISKLHRENKLFWSTLNQQRWIMGKKKQQFFCEHSDFIDWAENHLGKWNINLFWTRNIDFIKIVCCK